jgi:hypothetical protein
MSELILPDRFKVSVPASKSAVVGSCQLADRTKGVIWIEKPNEPDVPHTVTPYEEFCKRFDLTLEERVDLANYLDRLAAQPTGPERRETGF